MDQRKGNWMVLLAALAVFAALAYFLLTQASKPVDRLAELEADEERLWPPEKTALFPEVYEDPQLLDLYVTGDSFRDLTGPGGKIYVYYFREKKLYLSDDLTKGFEFIGDVVQATSPTGMAGRDEPSPLLVVGPGGPIGRIVGDTYNPN